MVAGMHLDFPVSAMWPDRSGCVHPTSLDADGMTGAARCGAALTSSDEIPHARWRYRVRASDIPNQMMVPRSTHRRLKPGLAELRVVHGREGAATPGLDADDSPEYRARIAAKPGKTPNRRSRLPATTDQNASNRACRPGGNDAPGSRVARRSSGQSNVRQPVSPTARATNDTKTGCLV